MRGMSAKKIKIKKITAKKKRSEKRGIIRNR